MNDNDALDEWKISAHLKVSLRFVDFFFFEWLNAGEIWNEYEKKLSTLLIKSTNYCLQKIWPDQPLALKITLKNTIFQIKSHKKFVFMICFFSLFVLYIHMYQNIYTSQPHTHTHTHTHTYIVPTPNFQSPPQKKIYHIFWPPKCLCFKYTTYHYWIKYHLANIVTKALNFCRINIRIRSKMLSN